jgi:rod shape-determining protein MreD
MEQRATGFFIDGGGRGLALFIPFVLSVFLVLFVNLPVSFTGRMLPSPLLALACVYYWVLVRPDLMPPVAVFMIGFLEDIVSGGPPGLWAAGFLAAYALNDRERDTLAGLSGFGAILGFAGSTLVAALTAYALYWVVYWRPTPLAPLFLETVVTVMFYPLVALPMGWMRRRVVGPMRRDD